MNKNASYYIYCYIFSFICALNVQEFEFSVWFVAYISVNVKRRDCGTCSIFVMSEDESKKEKETDIRNLQSVAKR